MNEANNKINNGIFKLLHFITLIDSSAYKYSIRKELNTYIRGRKQIEFSLGTDFLNKFLEKCGITTFDDITLSNHHGIFIDIHLQEFLKNSYVSL